MRLNTLLEGQASDELLDLLRQHPEGVRTSDLIGTPRFHGSRTLSPAQVRRLLRATGKVNETYCGSGMRGWTEWRLKP